MRSRPIRPQITAGGWGVRWVPSPDAQFRLVCAPHAGGGAVTFRRWAQLLAPRIEVIALRLPGRESRFGEPPVVGVSALVPKLIDDIGPLLGPRHAWFGHSMGGLIAFEACRELHDRGGPRPERLVLAATRAPHLPAHRPPVWDASDAEFVERLVELGGVPPDVLRDVTALSVLLPALRADFATAETYREPNGEPLDIPINTFGGTADLWATRADLQAWARYSRHECSQTLLPGAHFFPHESDRLPSTLAELLLGSSVGWSGTLEEDSMAAPMVGADMVTSGLE